MKTRFSSLVAIKKEAMKKSERVVQQANANLNSASVALELSYNALKNIQIPQNGNIGDFLASKTLMQSQREIINYNKEWVKFAHREVKHAQERLKKDTLEYEKFNYLEVGEIKKIIKIQKDKERKELDEIAVMTYNRNIQEAK